MDISTLTADEILITNGLPEYEEGIGFFFSELVDLNVDIFILEQILQFPFELFVERDDAIFWEMVTRNFFDAGVLNVTRLATDNKGDLHTLTRFKNRVRELVKPEYKRQFDDQLGQARFDQATRALFDKARKLRANRIAHTTLDWMSSDRETFTLNFSELKTLRDALNSLLDTLSFNVESTMLPVSYNPEVRHPVGSDSRADIEKILDWLARESHFLSLPERNPERWKYRRERLSEHKLKQLNRYRRKFNLPDV